MSTDHLSFCRICAAACGIVVTVEGDQVARVRGDAEHPYSRGYVCAKARGLPGWHHRADRLDAPRVRGERAQWTAALDDLGEACRGIIGTSGPDAIGLYLATGLAYDSAGQVAAGLFVRSIASGSFYTAATVDNAPVLVAAELVTGNPMCNPVWEPECDPAHPGLLVLVGTNPVVSHGYGTTLPDPVRRLRDFRGRGGRIWVLDPRRSESAAVADEHLAVRPGGDVALLAALARAVLADGVDARVACRAEDLAALADALEPFTVERAAVPAGVDVAAIEALVADVLAHRGRLAMFCGTGITMAADGVLAEWLRWVLLVLTDSLDRPGGMRFNRGIVNRQRPPRPAAAPAAQELSVPSRPDLIRVAGQMPAVALVDEIESGRLRALLVTGGNPIAAFPETERVRAALASLDVLAVVDVLDTELTALATHVLPATGQLERADITLAEHVSIRSGVQFTPAVVGVVGERRPGWWILASLAERLGGRLFGEHPDRLTDHAVLAGVLAHTALDPAEVTRAGGRGIDVPVEYGWVLDSMLPEGRWRIAPDVLLARLRSHRPPEEAHVPGRLLLTPRREMSWSNSVACTQAAAGPVVRLHPADAAASGLVDDNVATISSEHGTVLASVVVDDNVRRGLVSMTHGRADAPAGRLTSGHDGVDPLTAMPIVSGLPVTVRFDGPVAP